ncbi:MAG TPA: DUF4131 domain-containing protein, partial [Candidatus Desulfofervidus auxilii]|nr:DUF4131 domain-containing protein [Candidatus Desulfofervidus auxilii]
MKGWLSSHPLFFFLPFYCLGLLIGGRYHQNNLFFILCLISLVLLFFLHNYLRYVLAIFFIFFGAFWQTHFFKPSPIIKLEGKKVALKGKIVDVLGKKRFVLNKIFFYETNKAIKGKVLLKIYQPHIRLSLGHIVEVRGRIKLIRPPGNPGAYNYAKKWQRKGIWVRIDTNQVRIIGYQRPWFWLYILEKIRKKIRTFLFKHLSQPIRGVFQAILLGEKENILPTTRDIFTFTGTSHLLAISGLHLGMVMGLFYTLFWYIFSRSETLLLSYEIKKFCAFLAIFPSFLYASIAHFSPATTRSFFMLVLFWWLYFSRRLKSGWIFLAIAAWIMLLSDPTFIYSVSFELSFIALASIFYFTPKFPKARYWLTYKPDTFIDKIKRYFILCFYGSLSAWLGTLPLTMHYFGNVVLCTPIFNVIAIPWMGFSVLPSSLFSLLILPFSEKMALFFLKIGALSLNTLITFLRSMATWGISFWFLPNWLEVCVFYIFLFSIFNIRLFLLTTMFLVALETILYFNIPKGFEVDFLDVGKGTAIFLYFPNKKTMLIGGGGSHSYFDPGRFLVARTLWAKHIYKLNYVVLPALHYRYLNGLKFIIKHFRPEILWVNDVKVKQRDYGKLLHLCQERHIPIVFPKTQNIGGVRVEILYPQRGINISLKDSLFMRCEYQKITFLFPFYLKKRILKHYATKTDVLLAPNFGKKEANFLKFIQMTRPK